MAASSAVLEREVRDGRIKGNGFKTNLERMGIETNICKWKRKWNDRGEIPRLQFRLFRKRAAFDMFF